MANVQYKPAKDLFIPQIRNPEPDALGIFHNRPKKSRKRSKGLNQGVFTDQFDINTEMSDLNIPAFLQHAYLNGMPPPKINSLREWQKDLIQSQDWRSNKNCIILVPTSGGKLLLLK